MKLAWKLLTGLGVLLIISAFMMDTTVSSFGGQRVHNIGLQSQQQMLLILGCVLFLAGIGLFAAMKLKQTPEEEATEAAKMREATERFTQSDTLKETRELWTTATKVGAERVDGSLDLLRPAGDHVFTRLVAGAFVGIVWATFAGGLSRSNVVGTVFFLVPVVFALWRAPAPLVIGRLLKLNVALIVVMSAILFSKMDQPIAEVATEPTFIVVVCLLVVGPIVASLVALAIIRKRTAGLKW